MTTEIAPGFGEDWPGRTYSTVYLTTVPKSRRDVSSPWTPVKEGTS